MLEASNGRKSRNASVLIAGALVLSALLGFAFAGIATPWDAARSSAFQPGPRPLADGDSDGIADAAETQVYGTSPSDSDSDDDGLSDGEEILLGMPEKI